mgnify:CR=1 FL=1
MRLVDIDETIDLIEEGYSKGLITDIAEVIMFLGDKRYTKTAYDIDKVVEEIYSKSFIGTITGLDLDLIESEEAIDIIRNGGKE